MTTLRLQNLESTALSSGDIQSFIEISFVKPWKTRLGSVLKDLFLNQFYGNIKFRFIALCLTSPITFSFAEGAFIFSTLVLSNGEAMCNSIKELCL